MPVRRRFSGNVARAFSFQYIASGLLICFVLAVLGLITKGLKAEHDFKAACDGVTIGTNASVADARFACPPDRWLRIGNLHRWWLTHTMSGQDICDFEIDVNQNVVSVKYEIKKD
jgi:hypothetical protein